MSPEAAKALLQKENDLLTKFKDAVTQLTGLTSGEAEVLNGWTEYFSGWQAVNTQLIGLSDPSAFKDRLKKEGVVLKALSRSLQNDNSPHGKFYKEMFDKDATKADQMAGT